VYISLSDNGIDSNVTSGNNVFIAWANNDTGHWNVFVAKSTEAGKTLKNNDDKCSKQWKYSGP